MSRIANRDARHFALRKAPFDGSNLYGRDENGVYVVYSYGPHHPLFVFDFAAERWFENATRYSATTSKHRSQARPLNSRPELLSTETMQAIVRAGGVAHAVAYRLEGPHP